MKQILAIMFALAFTLSGVVGHASMVMDGSSMDHGEHSLHSGDHAPDGETDAAHMMKTGACAAVCAAACGYAPPQFDLSQRDAAPDHPADCVRPSLVGAITGFDPPPPKS